MAVSTNLLYALCGTVCAVVGAAVYINTLECGFCYDDKSAILENGDVTAKTSWSQLLWDDFWGQPIHSNGSHKSYRPLCVATFRLNYLLHELQPMGYHLVNVLLHGAVCYLYVQLCGVVFSQVWPALIAGLLYAVHPIHTEAVAGIVGRADLLAALFFILSFLSYYQGIVNHSSVTSHRYLIRCLLFMFCAVASKEIGLTVVGVCLTYDLFLVNKVGLRDLWWFITSHPSKEHSPFSRQFLSRMFPLVLFSVAILIGRLWLMKSAPIFTKYDNEALVLSSPYRQLHWTYLACLNSYLLFNPSVLIHDYRMGTIPLVKTILDPRLLLVIVTAVSYTGLLLYSFKSFHSPSFGTERQQALRPSSHVTTVARTSKFLKSTLTSLSKCKLPRQDTLSHKEVLLFGLSLMIFPFLPASNLFFPVGFVVAERVLYLPSMGFCMLVAYGAYRLIKSGNCWLTFVTQIGLVLLLVSHVEKTVHRSRDWYSKETLYKSMLKHNPTNGYILGNLALDLYRRGDERTAEQLNKHAMSVAPEVPLSYVNLGTLLRHQGRLVEAENVWRQAVVVLGGEEDPRTETIAQIYTSLCGMVSQSHTPRLQEALELCNLAVNVRSDLHNIHTTRGTVLTKLKRHEEAKIAFERALSLEPHNANNLFNLALAHKNMGNRMVAMEMLQRVMVIDHSHKLAKDELRKLNSVL